MALAQMPPRSPFQFSMLRLMVVVTLVAILLATAAIWNGLLGTFISALVWCVFPTPLVICAVYGRGDLQAFSLGAIIPWAVLIVTQSLPTTTAFAGLSALIAGIVWMTVLGGICGAVAVATRRFLRRYGPNG